jgi:hypothetical protein
LETQLSVAAFVNGIARSTCNSDFLKIYEDVDPFDAALQLHVLVEDYGLTIKLLNTRTDEVERSAILSTDDLINIID